MDIYSCTKCNYIYDEILGDKDIGIEPGQFFNELNDFNCPICNSTQENFFIINEEINYNKDSDLLSEIEKQHHINIYINDGVCKITIGKDSFHDMIEGHFIAYVGIYDEYGDIVINEFFGPEEITNLSFNVIDLDEFEVRIKCSVHGVWSSGIIKN